MSRKTGAERHTHTYHRMDGVWHCAFCSHFLPSNVAKTINNKPSICWTCGNEFRLDREALEMAKPVCSKCRNTLQSVTEYLKVIGEIPRELGDPIISPASPAPANTLDDIPIQNPNVNVTSIKIETNDSTKTIDMTKPSVIEEWTDE